jgi:hypothetical protein
MRRLGYLLLVRDDGRQEFLFLSLRYAEMVQRSANFDADFIELFRRNV